jgi:hypothetical protein
MTATDRIRGESVVRRAATRRLPRRQTSRWPKGAGMRNTLVSSGLHSAAVSTADFERRDAR